MRGRMGTRASRQCAILVTAALTLLCGTCNTTVQYLAAGDSSSNPRTHNATSVSRGTGDAKAARFGAASASDRHSLYASKRTSGHLHDVSRKSFKSRHRTFPSTRIVDWHQLQQ